MTPTPRTRLFGLVGHPVGHSQSPALHNAALAASGIDGCYLVFDVPPARLAPALAGAFALGVAGLNVTVPHKERALALADRADPRAALAGAANTLVPDGAGWRAHNTDIDGFLRALADDLGATPAGRRCWVLGAGGAARAVVVALSSEGAQEIRVANRNRNRAEALVADLGARLDAPRLQAVDLDGVGRRLEPGDLLVSATPAGLAPDGRWPWDLGRAEPGVLVYDLAYRSEGDTALVTAARAAGHPASSGRSMLLHQGAAAFSLWTGRPAPVGVMARALAAAR